MDILATLQTPDPELLTKIVRKAQHNPKFELADWTVESLNYHRIIDTTGGLYRFRGRGGYGQDDKQEKCG